jgi:hypothetical protein
MSDPKQEAADKQAASDAKKTTDAVDSKANVSKAEEKANSASDGDLKGKEVVLNANGMELKGKVTRVTNGAAFIDVDGVEYESTGYGFGKSQHHFPGEERPDEYKANANAR